MRKRFDHILYRDQIIAYSESGYYLKTDERPTTLLEFSSLEEAKQHVDTILAESELDILDEVELRLSIAKVVNDPDLLKKLTERDAEVAKKVLEVARLCGLLREATGL
jgi:hypothetical protein